MRRGILHRCVLAGSALAAAVGVVLYMVATFTFQDESINGAYAQVQSRMSGGRSGNVPTGDGPCTTSRWIG